MPSLLHNHVFVQSVAFLALLLTFTGIILSFRFKTTRERGLSGAVKKLCSQQTKDTTEKQLDEFIGTQQSLQGIEQAVQEARSTAEAARRTIDDLVKVLVDSHMDEVIQIERSSAEEQLALRELYATAMSERAPLASALSFIQPAINGLQACPVKDDANLRELVELLIRKYRIMQGVDSELASKLSRVEDTKCSAAKTCEEINSRYESGALSVDLYLKQVLAARPGDRFVRPDLATEQARYRDAGIQTADGFLSWLDLVNEVRDSSADVDRFEIASACTQIIRQSRSMLDLLDIEIDDVEIGRTQYDARLHDLLHTVPSPSARPETVVGVHKLGYRKNGKIIRKPQVVVAAPGI
jgi:hypothetical protein